MKLFVAGPEVFLPNGRELFAAKCELIRDAGFVPSCPYDPGVPDDLTGVDLAMAISANDERLIRESDVFLANLTPFRGVSADSGTVYELGFVCALEKPVHGYSNVAAGFGQRTVDLFKDEILSSLDVFKECLALVAERHLG
jgi:nucleoside 2-deoxyribosyltransferase